jgi:hypothetical protein
MSLRIRQIVLAASDLDAAVARFEHELGVEVIYRDPEVAKFGLSNALMAFGDQFIEIVTPTRSGTAAGRHLDRHGDSAYMLILQTGDLSGDRDRLERMGVRIVWESSYTDMSAVHLHPKDIGAAIVSLDQATPPGSWRWAGPTWNRDASTAGGRSCRIVGATISAREPAPMARRWSEVLGLKPSRATTDGQKTNLQDGELTFVASENGLERIVAFDLEVPGASRQFTICGTTFRLREADV